MPGQTDVVAALTDMVNSGARQMVTMVRAIQPLLDAYVSLLRTAATVPMSTLTSISGESGPASAAGWLRKMSCCDIPETSCPPYCVCELTFDGASGDHLAGTIALTNTRKTPQVFTLEAKPFRGPSGATDLVPTLSPASAALKPQESATIAVSFTVPESFGAGDVFRSDVTITGLYEQCVCVTLRTRRRPHCDVKQGEIPTHIKAHRWYDHFQCEELCFEPVTSRPQPNPNTPGTSVTATPAANSAAAIVSRERSRGR